MATPALKNARMILWGLVILVAVAATGLYAYTTFTKTQLNAGLGAGDYQLETADGQPFTQASFEGHPTALFFGYTHCPDVCPTTMAEMVAWYEALGDDGKDLKAYFVTVDPERDTADVIRDYVSWTGHLTGVTGSRAEVDKAIAAWHIVAEKVGEGDDYTMNHTASVFLLDRQGHFQSTIAYQEDQATAVAKLRRLISS